MGAASLPSACAILSQPVCYLPALTIDFQKLFMSHVLPLGPARGPPCRLLQEVGPRD